MPGARGTGSSRSVPTNSTARRSRDRRAVPTPWGSAYSVIVSFPTMPIARCGRQKNLYSPAGAPANEIV